MTSALLPECSPQFNPCQPSPTAMMYRAPATPVPAYLLTHINPAPSAMSASQCRAPPSTINVPTPIAAPPTPQCEASGSPLPHPLPQSAATAASHASPSLGYAPPSAPAPPPAPSPQQGCGSSCWPFCPHRSSSPCFHFGCPMGAHGLPASATVMWPGCRCSRPTSPMRFLCPTSAMGCRHSRPSSPMGHVCSRPTSPMGHVCSRPTSPIRHMCSRPTSPLRCICARPISSIMCTCARPNSPGKYSSSQLRALNKSLMNMFPAQVAQNLTFPLGCPTNSTQNMPISSNALVGPLKCTCMPSTGPENQQNTYPIETCQENKALNTSALGNFRKTLECNPCLQPTSEANHRQIMSAPDTGSRNLVQQKYLLKKSLGEPSEYLCSQTNSGTNRPITCIPEAQNYAQNMNPFLYSLPSHSEYAYWQQNNAMNLQQNAYPDSLTHNSYLGNKSAHQPPQFMSPPANGPLESPQKFSLSNLNVCPPISSLNRMANIDGRYTESQNPAHSAICPQHFQQPSDPANAFQRTGPPTFCPMHSPKSLFSEPKCPVLPGGDAFHDFKALMRPPQCTCPDPSCPVHVPKWVSVEVETPACPMHGHLPPQCHVWCPNSQSAQVCPRCSLDGVPVQALQAAIAARPHTSPCPGAAAGVQLYPAQGLPSHASAPPCPVHGCAALQCPRPYTCPDGSPPTQPPLPWPPTPCACPLPMPSCPPFCPLRGYDPRDYLSPWPPAKAPLALPPCGGGGGGGGDAPSPRLGVRSRHSPQDSVAAALGVALLGERTRPPTPLNPRPRAPCPPFDQRPDSRTQWIEAARCAKPAHILRGGRFYSDVASHRLNGIQDTYIRPRGV